MSAQSKSNFKGPWHTLRGCLAPPACVKDGRDFYELLRPVVNIEKAQPVDGDGTWRMLEHASFQYAADQFVTYLPVIEAAHRCQYCKGHIPSLLQSHCDNCGAPTP